MKKRFKLVGGLLLCTSLLLTACGGNSKTSGNSGESGDSVNTVIIGGSVGGLLVRILGRDRGIN